MTSERDEIARIVYARVSRERNTFIIAMAFLVSVLIGSFFYDLRVNDVQQLRQHDYEVCTTRNTNITALRDALTVVGQSTDTYTRAQIARAVQQVELADCGEFQP